MNNIILFDGECHFCDWNVQFIVKRDPKGIFKFASLQSHVAQQYLKQHNTDHTNYDSVILIEQNKIYTKSTAALRICKSLKNLWPLLYIFIIIPKPLRNFVYHLIAKNRHAFFNKGNSCPIPSPEIKSRFLT